MPVIVSDKHHINHDRAIFQFSAYKRRDGSCYFPFQIFCLGHNAVSIRGSTPFRRMPCKLFFPSFAILIPFINAIQLFMAVNEMLVKNITVTVSVRVSVTVRVSLV